MANHYNITYTHPYGQKGAAATSSVYMVTPDDAFMRAWEATNPDQADLDSLRQGTINEIKTAIESGGKVAMPIPHIGIERDDSGELRLDFIDGRHRVAAYKALGMDIPMLIDTNIPDSLNSDADLKAFVKPLPQRIKSQIADEGTGAHDSLHEDTRATIRKWALENEKQLRKQFRAKYGQFVGDKAFEFYARHGEMPPNHTIQHWQHEAKRLGHSTEPDKEAVQAIRRDDMRKAYASMVGEELADQCVDIAMATGRPIHRDTIEAVRSGISTETAIEREKQSLEPAHTVEQEAEQERPQTHVVGGREIKPTTASDRLARLEAERASRDAERRDANPRSWLDRGGRGGGSEMGGR